MSPPSYEPDSIQITQRDLSSSTITLAVCDEVLEPSKQEQVLLQEHDTAPPAPPPIAEDDDVSTGTGTATAEEMKTEITLTPFPCSPSSPLSMPPSPELCLAVLARVPVHAPVPFQFVSAVQGPGRGLPLRLLVDSDQSEATEQAETEAAPISGTDSETTVMKVSEKEEQQQEKDDGRRENIFSRNNLMDGCQEHEKQQKCLFLVGPRQQQQALEQEQQQRRLTISQQPQPQEQGGIRHHHRHTQSQPAHGDNDRRENRLRSIFPHNPDQGLEAALDECLGDTNHFALLSSPTAPTPSSSSDDNDNHQGQLQVPANQGDDQSPRCASAPPPLQAQDELDRLKSPAFLKRAITTTILTTATAVAVWDLDLNQAPQRRFQRLLSPPPVPESVFSDHLPPTSPPPTCSSASSTMSSITINVAAAIPLPPSPVDECFAFKDVFEVTKEIPVKIDDKLQSPSGPQPPQEQEPTLRSRNKKTNTILDAGFLNGLLAGTIGWWTKPSPVPASNATTLRLRHVNRRRRGPLSGDILDMEPFWDH
ncbi:hypothetical protein BGX33_002784 [Mortierella sp. NVP41]|nr:hypothetical protein BGX33_002784 [Mortierella sp. NVP41]